MKVFDTPKIKNIALLGHAGCGKTTLTEAMLYEAGLINRRGTVENGNTVSDFHPLEQERGNTVFSSLMHVKWKDKKINVIDTPGFDDFIGEVITALKVADTAIMVLNAQNGVEVGTEIMWEYAEKYKKPTLLAINQLDQDKADFDATVEQAKERFGNGVVVLQYPLNQGSGFNAIIDVLKMVMYKFGAEGGRPEKLPIPASEQDKAEELHNELVEKVAENDEDLMELYFDKGELSEAEMTDVLRAALTEQEIIPVFCCAAKKNIGSGRIMGFVIDHVPTPDDMPEDAAQTVDGDNIPCDSSAAPALFVYKTTSEQNLGNMSFFKVYSGTVKSGLELVNSTTGNSERINQLYLINGKKRTQVDALKAGDLGATVKLKGSPTNSTLRPKGSDMIIEPIKFPGSRIRVAVQAANNLDMEKLAQALYQVHNEDPTLLIEQSQELKQMLLFGQGELHLNIVKKQIESRYKLGLEFIQPRIPYRETIRKSTRSVYRHKKQSGGAGQFGEVHMLIEPYREGMADPAGLNVRSKDMIELDWGGKLAFYNCIVGGAIDTKYMSAITKGIMEKMIDGPLTGSYVRDIRVCVYDGKMHAVDSNDMAFKLAASMAFKNGFQDANPQLLEPIYDVEVLVASDAMGDVMGDLQTRRAMIMGMESAGRYQKILARVPLLELYKYSSTLRSLSQGRAKHAQRFAEYSAMPSDLQKEMIKKHQAALAEA